MPGHLDAEIVAQFGVDVDQRRWKLHAVLHREAQAMCLLRTVIRILTQQHDTGGFVRSQMQSGKDLIVWRKNSVAGPLSRHELLQLNPVRLVEFGSQYWIPVGLHRPLFRQVDSVAAVTTATSVVA